MSFMFLGNEIGKKNKKSDFLFEFCYFGLAELVAELVVFDSGMTFYPVPGNVEAGIEAVQLNPEVLIFYRFFICSFPAFCLPAFYPAGDSVFYVLTVYVYGYVAACKIRGVMNNCEGSNSGHELHAVVGSHFFAAGKLFCHSVCNYYDCPATGTRVSMAAAVCINCDFFHYASFLTNGRKWVQQKARCS